MRSTSAAGDSAAEIMNFLADFDRQSRASSMAAAAAYAWPAVPQGPYYSNLEISEAGYAQAPRAKYTRHPSSYDDSRSSFSTSLSGTEEESLYSISSAPSRTGPELPNRGRPMPPILEWQSRPRMSSAMGDESHAPRLPCEFYWYSLCEDHVALEDIDAWVQHVVSQHLNSTLPNHLVCWFCDGPHFQSQQPDDDHEAKLQNYRARTRHIAEHIRHGGTMADIRPDFHLLKHLHENGLISEELFQVGREYHEAPQPRQGISLVPCTRGGKGDVVVEMGVSERHGRHRHRRPQQV